MSSRNRSSKGHKKNSAALKVSMSATSSIIPKCWIKKNNSEQCVDETRHHVINTISAVKNSAVGLFSCRALRLVGIK